MTVDELLMQFQADVLGMPAIRPAVAETTALGAAYAAGPRRASWSSPDEVRANWREARRWEPRMDAARGRAPLRALARGGRAVARLVAQPADRATRLPRCDATGTRDAATGGRRARPIPTEGAAVLTITDTAAEAIRGIVAAPELPDGAGLRIATQHDAGEAALEVSVAESPAETDQVVDEAGARVFVEADAVPLLDDKLLDAQIEGTRVGFMLERTVGRVAAQSKSSFAIAASPTTTITPRSAGAGRRRPTRAPSWPPTPSRPRSARRRPTPRSARDHEHDRRDEVHDPGEHDLERVDALQVVVDRDAEDREQQDPLRGAEVAAVDAGQPAAASAERAARGHGRAAARRRASRRSMRGWSTMSTSASATNSGTIASNADAGSASSSTAPAMPPSTRPARAAASRPRCPRSSRR